MPSHNEQIKPAEFTLSDNTPPGPGSSTAHPGRHRSPRWVLPVLLALLAVIVFVVVWLPGRISQPAIPDLPASETHTSSSSPSPQGTRNRQAGGESSPWSDAQLAKIRKQAQDILGNLLDAQSRLEEIGVEQWAKEAMAQAGVTAATGDAEYREGNFTEAMTSYEQGLAELQALLDKAPQVLEYNLSSAREAIDKGDAETANSALLVATAIEPDNGELPGLKQRAAVMGQVSSLLEQAEDNENSGDLAQAERILRQAVKLDSASPQARSELERVTKAHTKQRFNTAMSNGYRALDNGQFDQARSAFRKAATLKNGSAVTVSALEDVDSAETAQRLSDLQHQGQAHEAQEQWAAAVLAFEQALQIDDSLVFARDGLKRSRNRARLDQQFRNVIDKPDRLSEKSVADATAGLIRQAATINPRGPVLAQQLEQLEVILEKANTPIPVTLRSDAETEVTLRKVARLGRFQERQLSLRPGTYVAVGTRDGYRDVRRTFSINHDSEPPTVVIACTEQI